MNILCIICMDELKSDENLLATRCGHIFHNHCLSHWNQTSNTCPQCRKEVTRRGLYRVYPTFSDEERQDNELEANLDQALQEISRLQTACKEKDVQLKHLTDTNNFSEQQWKERLANLQANNTDIVQVRCQLERLKRENGDLTRQLQRLNSNDLDTLTYQVDMLKMSLQCARSREMDYIRELQELRQSSVVREAVIFIISGTLGISLGIYLYPYFYPMPVQQSYWQKSVGLFSHFFFF